MDVAQVTITGVVGETIVIGNFARITVLAVVGDSVLLEVDAPAFAGRECPVVCEPPEE